MTSMVAGKMFHQEYGYVIRSIEKLSADQIRITRSWSKSKFEPGTHIKCVEIHKIGKDDRYTPFKRTEQS